MTTLVKLYSTFERFWHWTQVTLIVLLCLTGFEIHSTYKLFGFETAVRLHSAAAWAFLILIIFAGFWLMISGEWKQFIPTSKNLGAYIKFYTSGIFKNAPHPTKKTRLSKLNPLQRMVYLALFILVFPVQLISGFLYLYYHYPNKPIELQTLESVAVFHTLGAFLLVAFIIVHVYLITTGETLTSNLKAMVTGYEEIEGKEDKPDNK